MARVGRQRRRRQEPNVRAGGIGRGRLGEAARDVVPFNLNGLNRWWSCRRSVNSIEQHRLLAMALLESRLPAGTGGGVAILEREDAESSRLRLRSRQSRCALRHILNWGSLPKRVGFLNDTRRYEKAPVT